MNIEDVESLWHKDCKIDQTELAKESLSIPELHHKYYKLYVEAKSSLARKEIVFKKLKRLKHEYYTGLLDKETLKKMGWEPWGLKIIRNDLDLYLDSDNDMSTAAVEIKDQREIVDYIKSILESITTRGYQIKTALDFLKFTNGLNY